MGSTRTLPVMSVWKENLMRTHTLDLGGASFRSACRLASLSLLLLVLPSTSLAADWPGAEYAAKIKEPPKTDLDTKIKSLVADYESRLARLDQAKPLIQACLPRLRQNVSLLYREYNRDHKRYRGDHLPPESCIQRLEGDMKFNLADGLEKGIDPATVAPGRWQGKAYWVEGADILGQYDLIVPRSYGPAKPTPVVLSYQDDPDMDQMRTKTPYILIRCIQRGYPKGLVAVEQKTRSILKDAAGDFHIDPFRIYATGFSYGGRTDLIMAWRHPHWFAAIAPVCNDLRGDQTPCVKQLKNVPALLMHGTGDSFLQTGKVVHQLMAEAGCPVSWRTYPGGHAPTLPFRQDVTVLTKFFDQHVMNPYPKTVTHVVEHRRYSRAFWVNAKLVRDGADMRGIFEVVVKEGNRIEIDANDQVAELTLDLCEKLLDMNKPVTVVAGEKVLYQGKPAAALKIKLRDGEPHEIGPGDQLWRDLVEITGKTVYVVQSK